MPMCSGGPLPLEPASAGFSLQRSTGPFADRSRGWQNASFAQQAHNLEKYKLTLSFRANEVSRGI